MWDEGDAEIINNASNFTDDTSSRNSNDSAWHGIINPINLIANCYYSRKMVTHLARRPRLHPFPSLFFFFLSLSLPSLS